MSCLMDPLPPYTGIHRHPVTFLRMVSTRAILPMTIQLISTGHTRPSSSLLRTTRRRRAPSRRRALRMPASSCGVNVAAWTHLPECPLRPRAAGGVGGDFSRQRRVEKGRALGKHLGGRMRGG